MEINKELKDNILTIILKGRLDTLSSEKLDEYISNCTDYKTIHFDFTNVDYISSTGLRILLKYQKLYNDMEVHNVNENVLDVLKMTGFNTILNLK